MFKYLRWTLVGLLFLVFMINYLDRIALSLTVPMIEKDLVINSEQFGLIFGSFFFGYALFNFIGGIATDRYGPTLVMGLSVGFWSLFCGLTAVATGFWSLVVLRILFGMAEGPICASANKMISGWFPKKQAATAMGILSAGSPLGGAISGPIIGYLSLAFGWRFAFIIIAIIGVVWAVVWFFVAADSPQKSTRITVSEQQLIEKLKQQDSVAEKPAIQTGTGVANYFTQPIILVTAFAFFCYNYILFFFLSWFPAYLVQAHHLDIKSMSLTTMIPWIVGFIGLAAGGVISDKVFRMTGKLLFSRKVVLAVSLLIAAIGVGLAGTVQSVVPAVALMSVSVFFLYITGAIYWAIIQDVVEPGRIGSISGFIHLVGSISGIIGPIVTGYIVHHTGRFDSAFILAGSIAAVGAVLAWCVIREPKKRPFIHSQVDKRC